MSDRTARTTNHGSWFGTAGDFRRLTDAVAATVPGADVVVERCDRAARGWTVTRHDAEDALTAGRATYLWLAIKAATTTESGKEPARAVGVALRRRPGKGEPGVTVSVAGDDPAWVAEASERLARQVRARYAYPRAGRDLAATATWIVLVVLGFQIGAAVAGVAQTRRPLDGVFLVIAFLP